ncbi:hypothetical protein ABT160_42895 [Streptomyces sp. NPDC001941]|uniref:hypothetical protein n=1 Tax=Streptomyces sp. NPDC001941 TaxID=3154659 RepID=UPI00331B1FF2
MSSLFPEYYRLKAWQDSATRFEAEFAGACFNDQAAIRAAKATLKRLHEVLTNDWILCNGGSKEEARRQTAEAFYLQDPGSAGQIGPGAREIDYLLSDQSNIREVMAAIYNASWYRSHILSKQRVNFVDVGLKTTLQRIFFTDKKPEHAAKLGLNVAHLDPYAKFLETDKELLSLRAKANENPATRGSMDMDLMSHGCLALYQNRAAYDEVYASACAREFFNPAQSVTTPRDYALLGMPLSAREKEFAAHQVKGFSVEGWGYEFVPIGPNVEKDKLWERERVADVVDAYDGERRHTGYHIYKWQTYEVIDVRAGDQIAGLPGPEFPIRWKEGMAYFGVKQGSPLDTELRVKRGYPLQSGISGSAPRFMLAFAWLKVDGVRAADFLKAVIAYLVPFDHTLGETVKAATYLLIDPKSMGTLNKKPPFEDWAELELLNKLNHFFGLGARELYSGIATLLGISAVAPPNVGAVFEKHYLDMPEIYYKWDAEWKMRCLNAVSDSSLPAPPAPVRDEDDETIRYALEERILNIHGWLQRNNVKSGIELAKGISKYHLCALKAYQGSFYMPMIYSDNVPLGELPRRFWGVGESALVAGDLQTYRGIIVKPLGLGDLSWEPAALDAGRRYVESGGRDRALLDEVKAKYLDPSMWEYIAANAVWAEMAHEAIGRLPRYSGERDLYHGTWCRPDYGWEDQRQHPIARAQWTSKSFLSTSTEIDIAKVFSKVFDKLPGIERMVVRFTGVKAGLDMKGLVDTLHGENEVLFGRNVNTERVGAPELVTDEDGFSYYLVTRRIASS